jgi:lipoate synthase
VARERLGNQPARYSFLLNPYTDLRLSKCPKCDRPTHPRKFALFIHADGWGPLALGKTCRYCARCELVIAHKDELDAEVAHSMAKLAPAAEGGEYVVLGTVDRKMWQRGLRGQGQTLAEILEQTAEFEKVLQLEVDRGGWRPAGE